MKFVWRNQAPPRVKFFVGLVALGRVKSSELVLSRGVIRDEAEALCVFLEWKLNGNCGKELKHKGKVF